MKLVKVSALAAAVIAVGLVSCTDSVLPIADLVSDSTVTADVAVNSGEALAVAIDNMMINENFGAMPAAGSNGANLTSNLLDYSRTRTCYDVNGAVVAGCSPIASVRKVVTLVTVNGGRSGSSETTGGRSKSWSGVVHRISNDTMTRNFNTAQTPAEVSRTHSDLTVGHDTTTFTEGDASRVAAESSRDSVKAVTWNLPRSSNPWPVSGSIVRVDSVHFVATKGTRTETRDAVRKVEVDFPADAQGNVVLKINAKTCNLNLVTHVVSNCQ